MTASVRWAGGLVVALFAGVLAAADDPPRPFDPEQAFQFGDTDGDGKLSRDEFLKLVANAPRLKDNPELARRIFQRLDTNRDGFLSRDEFQKVAELRKGPPGKAPPGGRPRLQPEATPAPKALHAAGGFADRPTQEQLAFFEKKIRPVLAEQCYRCHAADSEKVKGGLLLDTRDGLRQGGDSGPVIVAGEPDKSLLIEALRHKDDGLKMPPKQKLPDGVVADFERWVRMGAPDPRVGAGKAAAKEIDIEKGRQFWAFQPPRKAAPPEVRDSAWPASDIDRFLLAALEARGLRPVADAAPRSLLRRVYLDLIGLPPTPEQVEAFMADPSPEAYARVVDELLRSPRFGERWGRHWLDVARYAESTGRQVNFNYPHAWRYRDYVIASFNADKPFDRFVKEQLAGDLLPADNERQKAEQVIATGFLAIGPKALNERTPLQFQMDLADEQIDVASQAFLGLTVACARCHDHKFDPIPSRDYYALAGIFRSTETCYGTTRFIQAAHPSPLIPLPAGSGQPAGLEKLSADERARIEKQLADLRKERNEMMRQDVIKSFASPAGIRNRILTAMNESKLALYEPDGTPKLQAMGVRERTRPVDSPLYQRGEVDKPGEVVPRGVLQFVSTHAAHVAGGSGRLELAGWVASRDNPLTARVLVNRVWLHLFGRGLVPTPDNFGAAGQAPTNPQLLDSLAVSFMEDGWSVKKLIRRLVLSHAYRLGPAFDARNNEADPDNALVWRSAPRRLDAETLRDSMLAVSGQLNLAPPKGSPLLKAGDGPTQAFLRFSGPIDVRFNGRSVYLPILRDALPESLALFDAADPSTVVAERPTTTVPAQGLYLLNNPFVLRVSEAAADRLLETAGSDSERIHQAYVRFYCRPPTDRELAAAEAFLKRYADSLGKEKTAASRVQKQTWAAFCQALFASAEFLYAN